MNKQWIVLATTIFTSAQVIAAQPPKPLPEARHNSKITENSYHVTQESKGDWAVNCRQRVSPPSSQKRCSATDGRQILKFSTVAEQPAQAFDKATTLAPGYVLQLAAFSSVENAETFRTQRKGLKTHIISTQVADKTMYNVVTPVISSFQQAKQQATSLADTLGYLPWIRTTDSL